MDFLQKSCYRRNRSEGGNIQLILGPMFSGKSTELMRRIKRYQVAARKCLTIKYAKVRIIFVLFFFVYTGGPYKTITSAYEKCRQNLEKKFVSNKGGEENDFKATQF